MIVCGWAGAVVVVVVDDVVVDAPVVVVVEPVRIGVNVVVNCASDTPPASGRPPRILIDNAFGQAAGAGAVGIAGTGNVPSTTVAIPLEVL